MQTIIGFAGCFVAGVLSGRSVFRREVPYIGAALFVVSLLLVV